MKYISLILLLISFEALAECPANDVKLMREMNVSNINKVRMSYDMSSPTPETAYCYYKIFQLEIESAIVKGQYQTAEKAAKEFLGFSPNDAWGYLYMQIALKKQNKNIPSWYSINKMPYGYANDAFIKFLSSQLFKKSTNN